MRAARYEPSEAAITQRDDFEPERPARSIYYSERNLKSCTEGGEKVRLSVILTLAVCAVLASCGSNSIFIGDTELPEAKLKQLLAGLPDSVQLVSAHESEYVIKQKSAEYSKLVVVTPGTATIAGKPHTNTEPLVIDILNSRFYALGESKEAGTDYFVYVLPAPVGKNFRAVLSRYHPDWAGYFSPGACGRPRSYSQRTWRLIGYFHVGPQGGILRNSVVTNANLSNPAPGVPLPGMVRVGDFAMDIYENSDLNGYSVSAYGRTPITNLTRDEAQVMARLCGKRLPTSRQWLAACEPDTFPQVLSTKPQEGEGPQNTWSGQTALTGYFASSNSGNGASSGCVDMVGNVWELCDEIVNAAEAEDMPARVSGYISEVTVFRGIPVWASVVHERKAAESIGYFFIDSSLTEAVVARGGSCKDGDRAGTASLSVTLTRDEASSLVGFRCVR